MAILGVISFGLGMGIEAFMLVTGFYDINAQITARRWHEMEERRKLLDESVEDQVQERFKQELQRRQRLTGNSDMPEEEIPKIPNLYNAFREKLYPTEKGWGGFAPDGSRAS
eukprot:TRINITY_DN12364_c1_g1_i2.p2 TRINITY_DN12364_c1_g1~~TRINITY_DN12364_c1_g1_i2.p2  ORF type:complete len:112 (+),score=22.31 TRINITY_DN12364_c1_g1_i2:140-475(+)